MGLRRRCPTTFCIYVEARLHTWALAQEAGRTLGDRGLLEAQKQKRKDRKGSHLLPRTAPTPSPPGLKWAMLTRGLPSVVANNGVGEGWMDRVEGAGGGRESQLPKPKPHIPALLPSLPRLLAPQESLAAHADVAGLAAGIFLGISSGQAHELVPADLSQRAKGQVDGLGVDNLQDEVLSVAEDQLSVFHTAGQELVAGNVQEGQPVTTEAVPQGALGCQYQDGIVVGCVHTVKVRKVEVGAGVEEALGRDLEAPAAIRGVLWGLACVELRVAAEEDAMQHATGWGAVATTVVLQVRLQHVPAVGPTHAGGQPKRRGNIMG